MSAALDKCDQLVGDCLRGVRASEPAHRLPHRDEPVGRGERAPACDRGRAPPPRRATRRRPARTSGRSSSGGRPWHTGTGRAARAACRGDLPDHATGTGDDEVGCREREAEVVGERRAGGKQVGAPAAQAWRSRARRRGAARPDPASRQGLRRGLVEAQRAGLPPQTRTTGPSDGRPKRRPRQRAGRLGDRERTARIGRPTTRYFAASRPGSGIRKEDALGERGSEAVGETEVGVGLGQRGRDPAASRGQRHRGRRRSPRRRERRRAAPIDDASDGRRGASAVHHGASCGGAHPPRDAPGPERRRARNPRAGTSGASAGQASRRSSTLTPRSVAPPPRRERAARVPPSRRRRSGTEAVDSTAFTPRDVKEDARPTRGRRRGSSRRRRRREAGCRSGGRGP